MAAPSAEIKVFPGHELTAQDFSILIERLSTASSGVINGCEPTVDPNSKGIIKISSGWCLIRGRLIYVNGGDYSIQAPTSGSVTYYLYIGVNLSDSVHPVFFEHDQSMPLDDSDFNLNSKQAYLQLGTVNISSSATTVSAVPKLAAPPNTLGSVSKAITRIYNESKASVTEIMLITNDEIRQILALNITDSQIQTSVSMSTVNAHWEAAKVKPVAIIYKEEEKKWYATFASSVAIKFRLNTIVTYSPNIISLPNLQ